MKSKTDKQKIQDLRAECRELRSLLNDAESLLRWCRDVAPIPVSDKAYKLHDSTLWNKHFSK